MEMKQVAHDDTIIFRLKLHQQTSVMPNSTDNHSKLLQRMYMYQCQKREDWYTDNSNLEHWKKTHVFS